MRAATVAARAEAAENADIEGLPEPPPMPDRPLTAAHGGPAAVAPDNPSDHWLMLGTIDLPLSVRGPRLQFGTPAAFATR